MKFCPLYYTPLTFFLICRVLIGTMVCATPIGSLFLLFSFIALRIKIASHFHEDTEDIKSIATLGTVTITLLLLTWLTLVFSNNFDQIFNLMVPISYINTINILALYFICIRPNMRSFILHKIKTMMNTFEVVN